MAILNEGAVTIHGCKILGECTRRKLSFSGLDSYDSHFTNYLGFLWILCRRGKLGKELRETPSYKGLAVNNIHCNNVALMRGWIYRSITHNKEFRNNPSLPHSAVCSGVSMPKQLNCKERPFQQRCFSRRTYTKWRSTQFQPYRPHKNSLEMGQCRAKATTHGVMCASHLRAGKAERGRFGSFLA